MEADLLPNPGFGLQAPEFRRRAAGNISLTPFEGDRKSTNTFAIALFQLLHQLHAYRNWVGWAINLEVLLRVQSLGEC